MPLRLEGDFAESLKPWMYLPLHSIHSPVKGVLSKARQEAPKKAAAQKEMVPIKETRNEIIKSIYNPTSLFNANSEP